MRKRYLFNWGKVPGSDSKRLLRHLKEDHNVSWADIAKIHKSNDGKIIRIFPEESHDCEGCSVEIRIDENKEKVTLEIDGIRNSALKVKHENGELNIYRKRLSDIGEALRKSLESQPKYWFVIVVSLVSSVGGGAIVLFVVVGNDLVEPAEKFDVFVELLLILLTFLAVLGYGMYIWIKGKLESSLDKKLQKWEQKIENSRNLFRARMLMSMGYNFWLLFDVEKIKEESNSTSNSTSDNSSKNASNRLIELALDRAKNSLDVARKLPEKEYKEDIYRCKNNCVYFLADAAFRAEKTEDFELSKQDKKDALKLTNEILAEVCKQDYRDDFYEYQESCAWALQHLSEKEDIISKKRAHDVIRKLQDDGDIPFSKREKIKIDWACFLDN